MTESTAYEIYTKQHLEELADSVNAGNDCFGKYFKIMNDINEPVTKMIGYNSPFASGTDFIFCGNFNGQGYRIELNIDNRNSSDGSSGLFAYIKNSTISNVVVVGNVKGKNSVAGIIGWADSSIISNCVNCANIYVDGGFASGIAASILTDCKISNCLNTGTIKGGSFCTGVIVGHSGDQNANNIIVSNCKNAGYVTASLEAVAGIVGHLGNYKDESNTIVIDCINTGVIKRVTEDGNIGGIGVIY